MKNDTISFQTKQRLAKALKASMRRKRFERITVRELLEEADVSRSTFYYHFEDIYALLQWTFENDVVRLLEKSANCLTWDDGIRLVLQYVHDNRKVCLCAYNGVGREPLYRLFNESVRGVMQQFVNTLLPDIPARPADVTFIMDFYIQALTGCLVRWLLDGEPRTPDELVRLLDVTMHGSIAAALKRSSGQSDQ